MSVNSYSPESNLAWTSIGKHNDPCHPQSFASVFDLNRQTIALLVDVAATPLDCRVWSGWRTLGNELARLDTTRRESLARCPFLLIDVELREATLSSRAAQTPEEPTQGELQFTPILLQNRLDHLAHATCLLAWHLVRSDAIAARLMLAMNSASTSLMAQVTLTDVRRIAQEHVCNGRVRPRWHSRPDIWSRLIDTARSPDRNTFANVSTRGLQLFLRELLTDEHAA